MAHINSETETSEEEVEQNREDFVEVQLDPVEQILEGKDKEETSQGVLSRDFSFEQYEEEEIMAGIESVAKKKRISIEKIGDPMFLNAQSVHIDGIYRFHSSDWASPSCFLGST